MKYVKTGPANNEAWHMLTLHEYAMETMKIMALLNIDRYDRSMKPDLEAAA